MASSEAVPAMVRLHDADAAGGLHLSSAAGWNQTADDWRLFLRHGQVVGCRDAAGCLVASAAALPYGAARGWISMVLVDPAWRRRGLATRLLSASIDSLRSAGRAAWLDATAAGEAVYRPHGFAAGFAFDRWEGEASVDAFANASGRGNTAVAEAGRPRLASEVSGVGVSELGEPGRIAGPAEHARIVEIDRAASSIERGFVMRDFLGRAGSTAWLTADEGGFAIARAGQRASQIGPVVAAGTATALALLGQALARLAGRVFLDVPVHRAGVAAWLAARGFVRQRSFVRMALGAAPAAEPGGRVFALAGPEFG